MTGADAKKRIAIFGSTGSIGTQALDVVRSNPDIFEIEMLTAQTNDELLITQALEFKPNLVVIGDEKKYEKVKAALGSTLIKVFTGEINKSKTSINLSQLSKGIYIVRIGENKHAYTVKLVKM